jgi:hypothetical protein
MSKTEAVTDRPATAHTPGPWIFSSFCKPNGDPIETVADVAETIAGSAKYSERTELFGVSLDDAHTHEDGRATVVCYTGNGPNAHNNARLMALAPELLDALKVAAGGLRAAGYFEAFEIAQATIAKAE